MHLDLGFHMGIAGPLTLWSHDTKSHFALIGGHPDRGRTASTWGSIERAKNDVSSTVNFSDWMLITFVTLRADVYSSPGAEYPNLDDQPTWSCSIEACHEATNKFAPLPLHRLQPNMARR
jgi:hypothetical protein